MTSARRVLLVAAAAAVLWALTIITTGWRLGWLTPAIGLAVGLALRSPVRSRAVPAVILTLVTILVGRGLAELGGAWHVSGREVEHDPTLVFDAVAAELYPPDAPKDDPYDPKPNAFEKMVRVQQEVAKMSPGERRAAVERYLGSTDVAVVRTSPAWGLFQWRDLLWWPAALWIAWRLTWRDEPTRPLGLVETPVAEFERNR